MPRLAERIDGLLNPLMVKEAHQSFRNRVFIGVGILALIVPLLMFGFSLITQGFDMSAESAGQGFFGMISAFFGIIALAAVPGRAAQQYQSEIKSRTLDLILLTGLSPWDLASGRFQAAGLQLVVVLAFIVPFAVASTLMGGIGLERVLPSLVFLLVLGLAQCSAGVLAVSTMVVSRRLGAVALIGLAFQMFTVLSTALVMVNAPYVHRTTELLAWSLVLLALITVLFLRLSADLITPGAVRTYARSKAIMLMLVAAFYVPAWLATRALSLTSYSDQSGMLMTGLAWFSSFAVVWSGSAARPGSGGRLGPLFANGFLSTTVYAVFTMLLVGGISQVIGWPGWAALYFVVYFLFFVGLAALIQTLWFVRNAEGFFAGLLVCVVIDVLASAVIEAQHGWSAYSPPSLGVFLPLTWGSHKERVLQTWFALPALIGALAMFVAHKRRAKIWHE